MLEALTNKKTSNSSSSNNASIVVPLRLPVGGDISKVLNSTGPIVNAVLLEAGDTRIVQDVQVDTTPKKEMVQKILKGPFTFLGQYEEEGIVLIIRRDQEDESCQLPINHHKLQPPFHDTTVKGDILALKVAPETTEQAEDNENHYVPNEDFFLNYTKEEYDKFASRTDIPIQVTPTHDDDDEDNTEEEMEEESDEEEVEGEDDSEDEEGEGTDFMTLLMEQLLKRFQDENGRMPDEQELQALELAVAQKFSGQQEQD